MAGLALRTDGYAARVPVRRLARVRLRRIQPHLRERLRPRSAVAADLRARFRRRIERSSSGLCAVRCAENDINGPVHMLIARPVMAGSAINPLERHVRCMLARQVRIRVPCGR